MIVQGDPELEVRIGIDDGWGGNLTLHTTEFEGRIAIAVSMGAKPQVVSLTVDDRRALAAALLEGLE